MQTLEDRILFLLVILISAVFAWVLWPFFGAILWAVVLLMIAVRGGGAISIDRVIGREF